MTDPAQTRPHACPRASTRAPRPGLALLAVLAVFVAPGSGTGLLVPGPAARAESPAIALSSDPRIRRFVYAPHEVYTLDTHTRHITTVHLAPGEAIATVAIGDAAAFEIVPLQRGDVFTVKPLVAGAVTSLTLLTDAPGGARDGPTRTYTFELRSHDRGAKRAKTFRAAFVYPRPGTGGTATVREIVRGTGRPQGAHPSQPSQPSQGSQPASGPQPSQGSQPASGRWLIAGADRLGLRDVTVAGPATRFTFAPGTDLPVLLAVGADGRESLVNTRAATGPGGAPVLVAGTHAARWTLRLGKAWLCVARADTVEAGTIQAGGVRTDTVQADSIRPGAAQTETAR